MEEAALRGAIFVWSSNAPHYGFASVRGYRWRHRFAMQTF